SRLRAEFIATDTSGIGYYNYSVSYNDSFLFVSIVKKKFFIFLILPQQEIFTLPNYRKLSHCSNILFL
ncbi:MAG: hypothetical protein ABIA74_02925, partial [bacterium]